MIPNGLIGRAVGIYRREGALALGAAACRSVYARSGLRDTVLELLYRRSGPSTVVRADGVGVTFRTVTASEFRRVRNLMDERGTIGDLLSELRTDDVFYDIGANVGMYSCFVAKVLSEGTVVAFEPHPANTEALTENLDLNGFDAVVRRIALSDRRGDTVLTETSPEAGAGGHSLSPEGSGQGLHVETDTLDRTVDAADLPRRRSRRSMSKAPRVAFSRGERRCSLPIAVGCSTARSIPSVSGSSGTATGRWCEPSRSWGSRRT